MDTCAVCCQEFTRVVRTVIDCPYCDFKACTQCVRTYLLDTLNDPHCMSCKGEWNPEFVDEHLSASFRTGPLAKRRRDILLEREKARLPDTVEAAQREKQKRALQQQLREVTSHVRELRNQLQNAMNLRGELAANIWNMDRPPGNSGASPVERRQFVRACPADGCRGFLTQQWRCELCAAKVCSKCHEIKADDSEEQHVCKPEHVATAELLAKDSKPCPSCAAMIFKIDGCDQMWCLACKTAFSWRTLRIEASNNIHNPEYYRWMRERREHIPRNPQDVRGGGCGDAGLFLYPRMNVVSRTLRERGIWRDIFFEISRTLTHIRHVPMATLNRNLRRNADDNDPNQDLRVRYLLNEIDEQGWKKALLIREKKREREKTVAQVYDMLVQAGTDILARASEAREAGEVDRLVEEADQLRLYYNGSCERIRKRFNTAFECANIQENWLI
jgi:hypothetical protein